jgi:glycosyl transferase family 25
MQRFVINLQSRPDRLAHMQSEFQRMGLEFDHFPALDIAEVEARGIVSPVMKGGILACTCSHIAVAGLAQNAEADFTLVCEDDVWFSDDARKFIENSDWIAPGVDMVKLETFRMGVCIDTEAILEFEGHSLNTLLSKHLGGAAYIMSRAYAAKLASVDVHDLVAPIDSILFEPDWLDAFGVRALQLNPAIAIQEFKLDNADGERLQSNIDGVRRAERRAKYQGLWGRIRLATRPARAGLKTFTRYLYRSVTLRQYRWRLVVVDFAGRSQ